MDVLKIEDLSRNFGQLKVIDNLNITVKENSVFGFIGKNGAGKTTTMKMILGFLKPDSGKIFVCGEQVKYGNTKTNRNIGYLPDVPEFYDYMTPKEYLTLCGEISGLSHAQIQNKLNELLPIVGLDGVNRHIKGFSRGMKQRLGIAQALFNEPKLLICDEPTSALDPVGRKEVLDILQSVKEKTTIIFSTHILSDVERICDDVGILNNGSIAFEGKLSEMKGTYRHDCLRVELQDASRIPFFSDKLQQLPQVKQVSRQEDVLQITVSNAETAGRSIVKILADENLPLAKFEVMEPDLEQVFMEVIGK
jgi:ABC-2 type transport system ATP-binding protein